MFPLGLNIEDSWESCPSMLKAQLKEEHHVDVVSACLCYMCLVLYIEDS